MTFFLIKPFLLAIFGGLILAYAFHPLHKKINARIKNRSISAALILLLILLIIAIPLWITIPIMINQAFQVFTAAQSLDISQFINNVFPTATADFKNQILITAASLLGKVSSTILNSIANLFLDAVTLLVNTFIVFFVFFYALRDTERLKAIIKEISPIAKAREKMIINQFKNITNSIVYGQILIGIVQGALAGLGLFIFGVPNALVLTALAIIISVIPIVGPSPIWIPVSIYIFATNSLTIGIIYLLYNLLIVSTVDNILRTYLLSRKISMSPALILLGMIGGLFLFGIMGLIIGPLTLAYLITYWHVFKDGIKYKPPKTPNPESEKWNLNLKRLVSKQAGQ